MIIESVFNIIVMIILGIVGLFPSLPKIEISFLDGIFQALSMIDMFVSLKVVSSCFVIIFVFMNIQVIWSVIMWVVRKLPGIE